jgi:nucleotide-binding universal stress UspA family protein
MYQRILLAFDGSDASKCALAEAARLAADQHATLRLLHVIDTFCLYHGDEGDRSAELEETWRQTGRELLEGAKADASRHGVEAETSVRCTERTRVSEEIVREAQAWGADVIVLGTHGRRGLSRLLLGSVAEGVARISPVSVLLVLCRVPPTAESRGDGETAASGR